MTAPRYTLDRAGEPLVELHDTPSGILITSFGWPRTLSDAEAVQLHAALGEMIASRGGQVEAGDAIPSCLHCAIVQLINEHAQEHSPRDERTGLPAVHMHEVLTALAQVIGGFVANLPEEQHRRSSIAFVGRIAGDACAETLAAAGDAHTSVGLH